MAFDKDTPFFQIDDSGHALSVIIDRGLLGQFPQYVGPDESHVASILDGKHPHHWLVACHFVGHTIRGIQSPYAVFAFSKLLYSRERVSAFMEDIAGQFGATGAPVIGFLKPDRN